MRKLLVILFIIGCFIFAYGADIQFVGSINSNVYHYDTCKCALNIKDKHKIYFNTPEEAINKGYRPCKVCKPPIFSKQPKEVG